MINVIKILLKKEFGEKFSGLKNQKRDVFGAILNVFLTLLVVGVFVFAFSYLANAYSSIKIGYVTNKPERVYEILTILFTVMLLLLVIMGTTKLNKSLIEVGGLTMLSLPVTPFQIFISKMIVVFTELVLTCLIISIPLFIVFVVEGLLSWAIIFMVILYSVLLPVLALFISSLLTIPFYYVKKWLNKHFLFQLVFYILIIAVGFIVYSVFLRFVKGLIESGEIVAFFNETNVLRIGKLCKMLFPVNIFSAIIVGKNIWLNILWLVLVTAIAFVGCYYVSKLVFTLVRHNRIGKRDELILVKKPREKRTVLASLMRKEYLNILRTPNYAFSYFAIVLSLPLMVVVTANILTAMMNELTMLNCDFEIVLCSVLMYSILLNSFCANNISRDGKFFNLLKTFPISEKKIVFSKIMFCSVVSLFSIILTGIFLLVIGIISPLKTLAVMGICSFVNVGIICIATRKDLNTTALKSGEENTSSSNFLIFWGLILSVLLTVVSFVMSIYLQTKFSLLTANVIVCLVLLVLSLAVFGISLVYLLRNLKEKFKEVILWRIKLLP